MYGEDENTNLALAGAGTEATASSCLSGYPIHQVKHLNDGNYGNQYSWIAAGRGEEWAQLELPEPAQISEVVFARDRLEHFKDRIPVSYEISLSIDGQEWKTVKEVVGRPAEVDGLRAIPNPSRPPKGAPEFAEDTDPLRIAFLGEEHAWLKTYGRADLSPRLVPYNGRVKEYPRHVGDDRIPLPILSSAPKLDGRIKDSCWREASSGVVRVAYPFGFDASPCVEHCLFAGRYEDNLFLAVEASRLLSGHLLIVSGGDKNNVALLTSREKGVGLRVFTPGRKARSHPVEGAVDLADGLCEVCLPLDLFPGYEKTGLQVGLGMGGKHTPKMGRSLHLVPSPVAVTQDGAYADGKFSVRFSSAQKTTLHGNLPELGGQGLVLDPGKPVTIAIPVPLGPIGPEFNLEFRASGEEPFALHLFRYDPTVRVLALARELAGRLEAKGVDTAADRERFNALREEHARLVAKKRADVSAERELFYEARMAKRDLFLRDPDLEPASHLLFVKRHAFRPSHNYSVLLDAPYRPGGGICTLDIPCRDGRYEPGQADVTMLFDAGGGIARTPMADFGVSEIYFSYRPSQEGYFHLMVMNPDGSGLQKLTDGPFHDYWPCPLPDGGLAFISTRCRARFLCWRPQAAVMFRMEPDGANMRPLSFANLSEWAPSVMSDGRIIWTRSEYLDKGADFGHTLWAIRPDGAYPQLVFGNDIIQPNGYANGREVPGTHEICCTLISHFGDLNGPIALLDADKGRFNQKAITSLTPEVPWPGMWPLEECFRDPVPIARDLFLCSHAPRSRFGLFVIDRYGNREHLFSDPDISSMCPTVLRPVETPPALADTPEMVEETGEFVLTDVYRGIDHVVPRGTVKYIRVVEEVRANLEQLPGGDYRADHEPFLNFYASPVDIVNGPYGWPTYVAKAPQGLVPVEEDGSARFTAPAGKVLYFQALDKDLNELQRMRSVVQLQPGEKRSCIGCHEHRQMAPDNVRPLLARETHLPEKAPWAGEPFSYSAVVQPVLDANCVKCHDGNHKMGLDFTGGLDVDRVPASYRTLITKGLVHYCDYGWNSGGTEKIEPLSVGTVKSKLWDVLNQGHHGVELTTDEMRRVKTWIDLNCPLWPDYVERTTRPGPDRSMVASAK